MKHTAVSICALLAAACMLLSACRTAPVRPVGEQSWSERLAHLQAQSSFALKGRVAVAAGEEGFNASLRWQQSGARSEVALDGPLGVGGVRVALEGNEFNVATARGEQLDGEAARAALAARLGFEPPLESLRYWILGVPDPSAPYEETLDAGQRLSALQQNGWHIEYSGYQPVAGQWLPQRLTLKREPVRARVFIEQWEAS